MFLSLLLATAVGTIPAGDRLQAGAWCYDVIKSDEGTSQAIGRTRQTVRYATMQGRRVVEVVVDQRMGRQFALKDTFVLEPDTLRPIELFSEKSGNPHVRSRYGHGTI